MVGIWGLVSGTTIGIHSPHRLLRTREKNQGGSCVLSEPLSSFGGFCGGAFVGVSRIERKGGKSGFKIIGLTSVSTFSKQPQSSTVEAQKLETQ